MTTLASLNISVFVDKDYVRKQVHEYLESLPFPSVAPYTDADSYGTKASIKLEIEIPVYLRALTSD